MADIRATLSILHIRTGSGVVQLTPAAIESTIGNTSQADSISVAHAAPMDIPVGEIATPSILFAQNKNATNYVQILDGTDVLAKLLPGQFCFIPLGASVALKAQANTADCIVDYAIFEAA